MSDNETDTGRTRLPRRAFLGRAGLGAAALAMGGLMNPERLLAAVRDEATGPYAIENGFFALSGQYGKLTAVAVDPTGHGTYEKATFGDVYIGGADVYNAALNSAVTATVTGDTLRLANIQTVGAPYTVAQSNNNGAPPPLPQGHTYGQSFTVLAGFFNRVGALLATYGSTTSGVTMTLYQGQPDGALTSVASQTLTDMKDNTWVYMDVPPQPGGVYYLELSNPVGTPTWWDESGATADVGGSAYADRQPQAGRLQTFQATGYNQGAPASWQLTLRGKRLGSHYTLDANGKTISDPGLTLVTPWKKDGYSISYDDGVLFDRFYGDNGQYMPAQQLKRRDSWGTDSLSAPHWIYATGTGPYDLRLSSPSITIDGGSEILPSSMMLKLDGAPGTSTNNITHALAIEALPHTDQLPDIFPVFVASDGQRAAQLSTFFYERAFTWPFSYPNPAGTSGADWKDWLGRILDWTATDGSRGEGVSLLSMKQDDDGYVWTWNPPGMRGWPFPDTSKYDTRHFDTNVMYILGAWRYYSWTGDDTFLTTMTPRLRKALDYCLNTMGGASGILTILSPDHTGEYAALGSNYWDITSFGYKSAYNNAYFYGALEAMAQLEQHLGNSGQAAQLRALRMNVRQTYNDTFWDDGAGRYIECIDDKGVRHDYGSTYVNLEAASFGLPSPDQAKRIFDWLDNGHTELTDKVVFITGGGGALYPPQGHTFGQSFTADKPFEKVGCQLFCNNIANSGFTLTIYAGGPGGTKIASEDFARWWDVGWAHLDLPRQPTGAYYLELSNTPGTIGWASGGVYSGGQAYIDGTPATNPASRTLVAISPYYQGPADIYSRWVFAPRATTRRNDFWYFWGWAGVTVPWEAQVQDGGADLYQSGFDVLSRAMYLSADNAWQRLTTILDRWVQPDHLCGGDPLYDGAHPQNEMTAGSVGVDIPFPESGLAPASFLYAFLGVDAQPDALVVTPNLPSALDDAGMKHLSWRGKSLDLRVTKDAVTLTGDGVSFHQQYAPGETVRIPVSILAGTPGGAPTPTPELGSGELLATGLATIAGAVLYRRGPKHSETDNKEEISNSEEARD